MASQHMMGAARGLQTAVEFNQAFQAQTQAAMNSTSLQMQMDEIKARTDMQLKNIYKQSEKVVAAQTAAFVSGGVELSGSAMSVISDTLNEAAQAAYIRQRESDYDMIGIGMAKYNADFAASDETLMLNLAVAGINGVANVTTDMQKYNRANTQQRGATGLGSADRAGGTTSYSSDYLNMK